MSPSARSTAIVTPNGLGVLIVRLVMVHMGPQDTRCVKKTSRLAPVLQMGPKGHVRVLTSPRADSLNAAHTLLVDLPGNPARPAAPSPGHALAEWNAAHGSAALPRLCRPERPGPCAVPFAANPDAHAAGARFPGRRRSSHCQTAVLVSCAPKAGCELQPIST